MYAENEDAHGSNCLWNVKIGINDSRITVHVYS